MPETRVSLELLTVFVAVAEASSFTKAAHKLGMGKGTVSRAIASLERQVGAELLHRTTHTVALSTAGTALYERTAQHLSALNQALQKLPERAEEPSGVLRLTAPSDFAYVVLPEVLTQFARRYPKVQLDLRVTNTNLDLVAQGFDLAIRAVGGGKMKDSTLTIRRLGPAAGGWFAAPSYLARRGMPKEVGEEGHDWILHPAQRTLMKLPADTPFRFFCDDILMTRSLAREGAGICMLPAFAAAPYVAEGLLQAVPLTDPHAFKAELALVYPSSGQVPRKITAFRDVLLEAMKKWGAGP